LRSRWADAKASAEATVKGSAGAGPCIGLGEPFVVALKLQAIMPSVDEVKLEQVRNELGYFDLAPTVDPSKTLVARIGTLATDAAERASRWALWAPSLIDYFEALREDRSDRAEIMFELYDVVRESEYWEGIWPFPRPEPDSHQEDEFDL
jgi:hypothetical protein